MSISFQVIDISSDDIPISEEDYWDQEFVITLYGKTDNNKNIVCNVHGFKPYFFIRVPDSWNEAFTTTFIKDTIIQPKLDSIQKKKTNSEEKQKQLRKEEFIHSKNQPCNLTIQKSHNFYGINYDIEYNRIHKFKFVKLEFNTYSSLRKICSTITSYYKERCIHISNNEINLQPKLLEWFHQEHNCDCVANLYESKIHPMLRFLHEKNIQSCGWIQIQNIPEYYLASKDQQKFNVDIEINNLPMKYIESKQKEDTAQFITASFDIECDSSHGDFPDPCKSFKKPAIDIHESYFRLSMNMNPSFDFKRRFILNCVKDAFHGGSENILSIYTQNGIYSEKSFTELKEELSDDFINDLDSSKRSTKLREATLNTLTEILSHLKNDKDETIQIKGDPIIQIGTVFHKYGDKECYDRSIIVIGNEDKPKEKICDEIPNVNVYECSSEKELLLKWKDLILYHNPDIITGYNIFGFDFDYINKRIDHLFPCHSKCGRYHDTFCKKHEFYRLGRLMRNRDSDCIGSLDVLSKIKP